MHASRKWAYKCHAAPSSSHHVPPTVPQVPFVLLILLAIPQIKPSNWLIVDWATVDWATYINVMFW